MTRDAARAPKVLFLCRGSAQHGLGHVVRSRAVASLAARGCELGFVVIGDEFVDALLTHCEFRYQVVCDETRAREAISAFGPDLVVVDLVTLESTTMQLCKQHGLVVSLSPIFDRQAQVDVLFHRTSVLHPDWRSPAFKPTIHSGLSYAVVSDHCHKISEEIFRNSLNLPSLSIAVSLGGTDSANKTLAVLQAVRQTPARLLIWVLLGEGYAHSYQSLVDSMGRSRHEVILAKTNDSMWRILSTCSLAILAGGVTTYEAAYAGLPSLNLIERDKTFALRELFERGVALPVHGELEDCLPQLPVLLERLANNRHELLRMHLNASGLLDDRGAQRIAERILGYAQSARAWSETHRPPLVTQRVDPIPLT